MLGPDALPTLSMCTGLDNYNALRYLRVLLRTRLAAHADGAKMNRLLAAFMAWLKRFVRVEKTESNHAQIRGARCTYMRAGKAACGDGFGETSKNHDVSTAFRGMPRKGLLLPAGLDTPPALPLQLRHSEREEQEDGTWHYFYDGCAEQRQKEIKSLYEHATNRRDSAGSSVELQIATAACRTAGVSLM